MANKASSSKESSSLLLDDFAPSYSKTLEYPPLKNPEISPKIPTMNRFTPLKAQNIPERTQEPKEYHIKEFCQNILTLEEYWSEEDPYRIMKRVLPTGRSWIQKKMKILEKRKNFINLF